MRLIQDDRMRAMLLSEIINNGLITIMLEGRGGELKHYISTMVAEDLDSVRLYNHDGELIASSKQTDWAEGSVYQKVSQDMLLPGIRKIDNGGIGTLSINTQILNEKSCQVCHATQEPVLSTLIIDISMDRIAADLKKLMGNSIVMFSTTLLVTVLTVWFAIVFFIDRPVANIISTINEVKQGDFGARVDTGGKDFLSELGRSFNSMLDEQRRMRKELETCHLQDMQRMEKMATIGELSAAIAHEIKNPLAGISGAIQVLSEDYPADDPRREIIIEVQNEIGRLDKAVRDLLNYARPPELHLMKTPVDALIERAVRLTSAQAKKLGINVNIISLDTPVSVNADPEQMHQVILNVIMNAIQSMPAGGALTITMLVRHEESEVEISIADTGAGIPQEHMDKLFKPFFTTKHAGTGLGLAISKDIIDKHNGRIVVESSIARGSNFRLILPLER